MKNELGFASLLEFALRLMLRWLYPQDRDYSFTLWDLFVSLTLLAVYVAGFRMLVKLDRFTYSISALQDDPDTIYLSEVGADGYELRANRSQQIYVVVYQLAKRPPQEAHYQRTVIPLPPMQEGLFFWTTSLDALNQRAQKQLVFNGQAVPMVLDSAFFELPNFGDLNMRLISGRMNHRTMLMTSDEVQARPNGNHFVPYKDCFYAVHLMTEQEMAKAPITLVIDR